MKQNYSDLLKDPRWQKKRLQILKRDKFKCKCCGAEDKTLHVHHKEYQYGKAPWEYPNKNFLTLCEDCHIIISGYGKTHADDLSHCIISQLSSKDSEKFFILYHKECFVLCGTSNNTNLTHYVTIGFKSMSKIINFVGQYLKDE